MNYVSFSAKIKRFAALLALTCAGVALYAQESEILYLSGKGVDDTKTWRFKCSDGRLAGKWGKIEVPSQWEIQGYGEYTYGRWYKEPGVKKPSMEEGFYEYSFKVPADWKDRKVTIWFDGVMTDTEVSINGVKAGEIHQGGFYRFSYDITSLLNFGKKNKLEVHVWKHSANKSVNAAERMADWWLFGGIYRPVWLEATPQEAIEHIAVDAKADGKISALVEMCGNVSGYELEASVSPINSTEVVGTQKFKVGRTNQPTIQFECSGVNAWTCEDPYLYELTVKLNTPEGKTIHSRKTRIGFRTIEFRPKDGIYLNNTKLIVKGVNRHSFWPEGGRTTSKELSIMDAELIKEMNMNAVRSHYPPDDHFLDACDSLGLLYIDELAGWQNCYDNKVGSKLVPEMIRRDVNHPCIFIWSNGNEGGWNYNLDDMFAQYDPQRRHVIHPWADFNQLDTHHYPAYLTGVARFNNGSNVFMPTEFMHAMYDQGGGAGLADFWNRWLTSPLFAGGFIWVYCDEAPMRSDKGGILDSDKSNAPDGIVGPRREKEGSFYTIREVWSPIQIKPIRVTKSFTGELFVSNAYLFRNLKGCRLDFYTKKCPSPLLKGTALENVAVGSGSLVLPDVAPGETRRVVLPLQDLQAADILEIVAIDADGRSLANWTFPVHTPAEYLLAQKTAAGIATGAPRADRPATMLPAYAEAQKEDATVQLLNGDTKVVFSAQNGQITQVERAGKVVPFNNGPVAIGMKMKYNADKSLCRIERGADGREVAVYVARYQGAVDSIVWKLDADGRLAMDAVMLNRASGGGGFDDAFMDTEVRNLGLSFSYPESECKGMTWLGRGPYRVWKNRIPGTNYGIWQKDYNNTITGESFEQLIYPEFKGYHANLYWASLQSDTAPLTVYCESENIYFCVFTPEEPVGRAGGRRTMPAFPAGDLSFLLDIPAIQSFKPISQQGPQSQPGNIRIKSGDDGLRIRLTFEF